MKKILATKSLKPLLNRFGNFLSKETVEIIFVQSEEDIVKAHSIEDVDLIIMEITETSDNIEDACSIIRNDDVLKKVSIILISEKDKSVISKCHACKVNDYITKPVNHEELLRKIHKILYPVQRNHLRVQLQVLVKGKSDRDYFFANSKDISSAGILIESDRIFGKGEKVKCSFFLESNNIKTIGQVVRVVKKGDDLYDYGLEFVDIDSTSREIIENFINTSTKNLKSIDLMFS